MKKLLAYGAFWLSVIHVGIDSMMDGQLGLSITYILSFFMVWLFFTDFNKKDNK